ncbi:MAG: ribosome maturation factor [Chitinophagales bacterium]|nr:ribosome maturation factor [Chitinophagales bacterium]
MEQLEKRIREILDETLKGLDAYLVDLKILPTKVEVFADKDPRITIDDCVKISRSLEKQLDAEFPFSEQYSLEVSSPGMYEPFKILKQYQKRIGSRVDVLLKNGIKKSGVLKRVNDDGILIEEEIVKSKKDKELIQSEFLFSNIKSTTLVFNPKTLRS